MKPRICSPCAILVAICTITSTAAFGNVVYHNDFEGAVGAEWSNTALDTSPGGRTFLGQFVNDTVSLSLGSLPPHAELAVSFDVITLFSWDGSDPQWGPDHWKLSVSGGPTLLDTTFTNRFNITQAYPDNFPGGSHPFRTGASEVNTLGYAPTWAEESTVYRVEATFPHTDSSLTLDFEAWGLQTTFNILGLRDESWGIDNVRVTAVPEPLTIVGTIMALGTLGAYIRRRGTA